MSPLSLPRISVAPLESEQLLSTSPTSSNPVMEQVSSLPLKSGDHILTLTSFPASAILATGGFVSAASVKIIENTDKETRALWWMELREELKTHAKSLGCNSLVGYSEQLSIEDDVALFHCTATAVVLNFNCFLEEEDLKKSRSRRNSACQSVHASYNRNDSPFPMAFVKCGCCGKCHVPEILLCGIQPSADLEVIGKGALVEAHGTFI